MVWRRPDDKPLSEPMIVTLLAQIYVTRLQWVKNYPTHFYTSGDKSQVKYIIASTYGPSQHTDAVLLVDVSPLCIPIMYPHDGLTPVISMMGIIVPGKIVIVLEQGPGSPACSSPEKRRLCLSILVKYLSNIDI